MGSDQGWFESDEAYRERISEEADERTIENLTGEAPSKGFFETDEGYRERVAEEANEARVESSTGEAPSQSWFETTEDYHDRIAQEANERTVADLSGSEPSQRWHESDADYDTRIRREANELLVERRTESAPKQPWFEGDHEYRSRIAHEAREVRAREQTSGASDSETSGASASSSYISGDSSYGSFVPSVPLPHSPEIIAARAFAAASGPAEVRALKSQFAGKVSEDTLEALYRPHIERLETAVIEARLRRISGRTEAQLDAENWDEFRRLTAEGKSVAITDLETFKLLQLARIVRQMEEKPNWDVEMLAGVWIDSLPEQTIIAKRRLAAIREEAAAQALQAIEPIESATFQPLSGYFLRHQLTDCAAGAMRRVTDKHYLAWFCHESLNQLLVAVAKETYFRILDREHATRSFWEKIWYDLYFRDRERKFLLVVKKIGNRWCCV
jgi:hypothetical protein